MNAYRECITSCGNETANKNTFYCKNCFVKKCIYERKYLIRTASTNTKE